MKEARYFYVPDAAQSTELPSDEALHAMRVLRLREGDEIFLMDGQGMFYRGRVTLTAPHHCCYELLETLPQQRTWQRHIHLAIAPTKMMERMEWLAEKVTEIGIDELSFLDCQFSERRQVKAARIEKIVVSALKQSRKPWLPVLNEITPFDSFLSQPREGRKFIAHCYDEIPRTNLFDELCQTEADVPTTVLVGPEGDFSIDEVRKAVSAGFQPVSLGEGRLRTETAGLVAVTMMQLGKQDKRHI